MKKYQHGKLIVIAGPNRSGKSEELLRMVKRYEYAKVKTLSLDAKSDDLVSEWNSTYTVVSIDNGHYLDESVVEVITTMLDCGVRILIGGLDMSYTGEPYNVMAQLLAIADKVIKVKAVCMVCGSDASMSYRKDTDFEPRCRSCHTVVRKTLI